MGADFRLGNWIVRPQRRIIARGDKSVHIKPKSMAVFECLVAADGAPVSRNELFDTVWPGGEVSDDTLTKCVVELRKAFDDTARDHQVIETIPKLGFRLVLPVEPLKPESLKQESLKQSPLTADQSSPESQARRGGRRMFRSAGLLLVAVLLSFAVLLSIDSSRLWLTEAVVTLILKTAATLAPHSIEQKPGIAVLPFVNMSSDGENEYFSEGMSEEILNALARTHRLPVIARTSSFQFKGQARDIKEIGRLLGVTHVLEGSVRKADESVRITAQLIDTATGAHVWSDVYQRELSDIFVLQAEITQDIVHQVGLALGDEAVIPPANMQPAEFMVTHPTSNLEAYDLYLKGVQMLKSTSPLLIEQAEGYFDQAIALDEYYADAWAAKGQALHVLGRPGYGHPHIPASVYPGAIAAYRRALQIEPGHAFATGWLGVALILNDYQWAEGMGLIKQSLARNPNNAALLSAYGVLMRMMRIEGAEEMVERAYRLDPFGMLPITIRAGSLTGSGQRLGALTLVETSLIGDREGYAPNYFSAFKNLQLGRLDAAEEHLHKARLVAHPDDLSLDGMQWAIDTLRGEGPLQPIAGIWERLQTERLSYLLSRSGVQEWEDEKAIVAAFDLAIEQRYVEVIGKLFGSKPPLMPAADWRRMKDITGVTEYQSSR